MSPPSRSCRRIGEPASRTVAWVPVGTSLREGSVRSMPVVVSEVLGEHLIEVTVAADEHAVQALAPKGAYDPLAYRVRIRRPHGRADDLDAFGGEHPSDDGCYTPNLVDPQGSIVTHATGCFNGTAAGVGPVTLNATGTWAVLLRLQVTATSTSSTSVSSGPRVGCDSWGLASVGRSVNMNTPPKAAERCGNERSSSSSSARAKRWMKTPLRSG